MAVNMLLKWRELAASICIREGAHDQRIDLEKKTHRQRNANLQSLYDVHRRFSQPRCRFDVRSAMAEIVRDAREQPQRKEYVQQGAENQIGQLCMAHAGFTTMR